MNYREYLIATGAVFLALALGILIGVSFGDGILAANQRNVMELMEDRLARLQETRRQQDLELQRWEGVKPLLHRGFRGLLAGKEIVIFSCCAGEAGAVKGLLEAGGAGVTLFLVQERPESCGKKAGPPGPGEEGGSAPPLDAGMIAAGELEAAGLLLREGAGKPPVWPPDCCLLLPAQGGMPPGGMLEELWCSLHEGGLRTIALFPWQGAAGVPAPPGMEPGPSLVDNIDTFWGQIALLLMLAEGAEGHYGFDSAGEGLFPAPAGVDWNGS